MVAENEAIEDDTDGENKYDKTGLTHVCRNSERILNNDIIYNQAN